VTTLFKTKMATNILMKENQRVVNHQNGPWNN